MDLRRREVLRQASVALAGRTVALWEVSPSAEVVPVLASAAAPRPGDTRLDLESTLHRWSAPIIQGSRWVGCRLDDNRSEEHTSELQSLRHLVCRLLLEKKKNLLYH